MSLCVCVINGYDWLRIVCFVCVDSILTIVLVKIYTFYCSVYIPLSSPVQNNWIRLFLLLECTCSCCWLLLLLLFLRVRVWVCVCVFAALLLVVRFVLFLYWYIMEEFELPWAIISFISLLVLCMWLLLLLCMYLFVSLFISECAVRTVDFAYLIFAGCQSKKKHCFVLLWLCCGTKILRLYWNRNEKRK